MELWKMIFLFKQVIFSFHFNSPGCISQDFFWRNILYNLNGALINHGRRLECKTTSQLTFACSMISS